MSRSLQPDRAQANTQNAPSTRWLGDDSFHLRGLGADVEALVWILWWDGWQVQHKQQHHAEQQEQHKVHPKRPRAASLFLAGVLLVTSPVDSHHAMLVAA